MTVALADPPHNYMASMHERTEAQARLAACGIDAKVVYRVVSAVESDHIRCGERREAIMFTSTELQPQTAIVIAADDIVVEDGW